MVDDYFNDGCLCTNRDDKLSHSLTLNPESISQKYFYFFNFIDEHVHSVFPLQCARTYGKTYIPVQNNEFKRKNNSKNCLKYQYHI